MKKITALLLSALLVLSLAACGNSNQNSEEDTPAETEIQTLTAEPDDGSAESTAENGTEIESAMEAGSGNILIAYFSVMETDGMDTVAGASRVVVNGEVLGNNEYIAQIIQRETGGELFTIETVQEYPTTHDPLLEFAYNEKADNARPELVTQIENIDSYNVIFLGYPNWNADLPMPLYTFLDEMQLDLFPQHENQGRDCHEADSVLYFVFQVIPEGHTETYALRIGVLRPSRYTHQIIQIGTI